MANSKPKPKPKPKPNNTSSTDITLTPDEQASLGLTPDEQASLGLPPTSSNSVGLDPTLNMGSDSPNDALVNGNQTATGGDLSNGGTSSKPKPQNGITVKDNSSNNVTGNFKYSGTVVNGAISPQLDNNGGISLQFISDGNPSAGITSQPLANVFFYYDKQGHPSVEQLDRTVFNFIKSLKPEQRAWFKDKFIRSGLMNADAKNAAIENNSFTQAVTVTLQGLAMRNFKNRKGNANLKEYLNSSYADTPSVIDTRKYNIGLIKGLLSDNGISMNDTQVSQKANMIAMGTATLQGVQEDIRNQAKTLYPQYADLLSQGKDLKNIISPYINTASNILELSPDEIDLSDPKSPLKSVLNSKDKDGKPVTITPYEFENQLKQDPRWMKTKNAAETFANLYQTLYQGFGLS